MKIVKFLRHLFIPHESNNQKARILHTSSILKLSLFLMIFQVFLNFGEKSFPKVLGYAANISPSEVIRLINIQRQANGLSQLNENTALDAAALAKGNDMLAKGYWAHFAPDGTSPWSFFLKFGYKYKYAGENLARDFSNATDAVNAWMASQSHRENILNPNYRDIGIGVVEGNLAGVDTTVIVQFLGSPLGSSPSLPLVQAKAPIALGIFATPTPKPKVAAAIQTPVPEIVTPTPFVPVATPVPTFSPQTLISPFTSSKNISIGIAGLILFVFAADLIIVRRRRIVRIGGRTLAHMMFLGGILAILIVLKAGKLL